MDNPIKTSIASIITLVIAAVAWHSVWEIHFLKSFFPVTFSVQEAFYATIIEWIKFLLVSVPLVAGWLILKDVCKK